ncbi:MAG: NAD kinase [Vicingaceae bacterium]
MKVALYGKSIKDEHADSISKLLQSLSRRGDNVFYHESLRHDLDKHGILKGEQGNFFKSHQDLDKSFDFMISIGGDGTFLDTILLVRDLEIPILGINTGRLGFLSNTPTSKIEHAIDCLREDMFHIEKRSLLQMKSSSKLFGANNYALNEISILKRDSSSMISIDVKLDEEPLNTYWTDGLIISTATGSTAYSLSCGGPILMPGSGNFVITPIAPHNLNVRPMVIDDQSVLKIKVEGRAERNLVALDSRSEELQNFEELTIQKADHQISLVQIDKNNFINSLKAKLNWGLDKRNK